MFKRNTIRVKRPPEEFVTNHGNGAVVNPWLKIEQLSESRESMKDALDALHKRLREAEGATSLYYDLILALRQEQLLEFFAQQGVTNTLHSHAKAKSWEIDGASVLALPDGWTWRHRIVDATIPYRGSHSVLSLVTPDGHTLKATNSLQDEWDDKQEPFRRREMLMASQRILRQLLPEPKTEQPGPIGLLGGDE